MTNPLPIPLPARADAGAEPAIQHAGELSWRDFSRLVDRVKAHLEGEALPAARRHRAFSTFVEIAYNVLNHGLAAEPLPAEPWRRVPSELSLGHERGGVWIASANLVDAQAVPALERRVRALRAMAPDEIRAAYREQLARTGQPGSTASTGGGLGLLTIARDVARPIEFSFVSSATAGATSFRLKVLV